MSDGRQSRTMLLADVHDHDHVRQLGTGFDIEPVMGLLRRHIMRKGTKHLTFLNQSVHQIKNLRMPQKGKKAALSEREGHNRQSPEVRSDTSLDGRLKSRYALRD